MKIRALVILLLSVIIPQFSIADEVKIPDWIESYGRVNAYDSGRFLTGFGMAKSYTEDEPLEAAKLRAADDLIRKIRVELNSSIVLRTNDGEGKNSQSLSMVTQSISLLQLEGITYDIEQRGSNYYALAVLEKYPTARAYLEKARGVMQKITLGIEHLGDQSEAGYSYEELSELLGSFQELYECDEVYRILAGSRIYSQLSSELIPDERDAFVHEGRIRRELLQFTDSTARDISDAVETIGRIIEEEAGDFLNIVISPFLYESSDFSSSFGNYLAERLRSRLSGGTSGSETGIAVFGRYWLRDGSIELTVNAVQSGSGEKVAGAYVVLPSASLEEKFSLQPDNSAAAIADMLSLADGAISDEGLQIECWSNKGSASSAQIFSSGESLELFLKVNQPSFIQLTYILATGEKVLLEDRFYIGVEKVNRVVRFPYTFEIVPPFGVERLIIGAFNREPPQVDVKIQRIEGQEYRVFSSIQELTAATRGLRRKNSSNPAVQTAEASITLTTIKASSGK